MKPFLGAIAAAALLAGCSAPPYRYDGADAATLAGDDALRWADRTLTMVVELNGQPARLPYTIHPVMVRPGVLKVGVHVKSGGALSAACFEVEATPGGYYQFSATPVQDGFAVALHEGRGAERRLIGKAFVPARPWMHVPAYCPAPARG